MQICRSHFGSSFAFTAWKKNNRSATGTSEKQNTSKQHIHFSPPCSDSTLEFLDKKHVQFDQGRNFLIFYQGNRGENQENHQKNQKKIRKDEKNIKNKALFLM